VGQEILFDLRFSKLRFGSSPADEGKAAPFRNGLCKFCFVYEVATGLDIEVSFRVVLFTSGCVFS
jgi:hypothetical protein